MDINGRELTVDGNHWDKCKLDIRIALFDFAAMTTSRLRRFITSKACPHHYKCLYATKTAAAPSIAFTAMVDFAVRYLNEVFR